MCERDGGASLAHESRAAGRCISIRKNVNAEKSANRETSLVCLLEFAVEPRYAHRAIADHRHVALADLARAREERRAWAEVALRGSMRKGEEAIQKEAVLCRTS